MADLPRRPLSQVTARLLAQENFLKGQIAENVVERLMDAHGYEVLPFGIEKRFPGWLHDPLVDAESGAYRQMRAAPDFVVKVPGEDRKRLFPIEVKFRAGGMLATEELRRYADLEDVIVVLVDRRRLRANFVDRRLQGHAWLPIAELQALRLRPELVAHFERIVHQVFDWHWEEDGTAAPAVLRRTRARRATPKPNLFHRPLA